MGVFLRDNAAMPPAYRVKVQKCASFVDILDVCKFTTFCDREGYTCPAERGGVVHVRMRVQNVYAANYFCWGLAPIKNEWNKWKNHFYEMKGDVGMSLHEKGKKQEDTYTKTQSHS